ncbi:UDP pyrophosphate synthase [Paucilactobacillus hokkaidonensis JCM 18461]|uniref:Isoprenyl transferase n=2 Tax=Paucilactobacillus hokkaidonensis TaxID=1193095 RepID=A0A0A1GXY2_9LACO|nr:isoprenyl transferase [Paucilactobacillus hokkaidonensis]KRO10289.1 undecaprenyl diphosphate synthase [Paucilactobacillus hokkaidonensis]BAP85744.1 UDP pyrophosphate synthase [Paucilactobacillus hokkaidonensis JCM 18461]
MFAKFKKNQAGETEAQAVVDSKRVPAHIAIIMDGNGRWANQRHLPRIAGHKEGMQTVKKITIAASQLGVKVLSLYAFSTENWKRPTDEVNYLMQLPVRFFQTFVPDLIKHNVRVTVMGDTTKLPAATQKAVKGAIDETSECNGMVLNFALNYGGRDEIVTAVQQVAQLVKDDQLKVEQIDESVIAEHLMTNQLGEFEDPELIIRTSGEQRVSNFMLWQLAYSEFVFMPEHWPDFTKESLENAIIEYQGRHRRFGGLEN